MGAKLDFISAIALKRKREIVAMLLANPSLIRRRSPDQFPAIHMAARYGDAEIVDLLLSKGADVNDQSNPRSLTPLFLAWNEPRENAELLLGRGANVHARSKHGFTVLHSAAGSGRLALVRLLLAHGACLTAQSDGRQTPWALAVRNGHRDVAALLNDGARI